MHSIFFRTTELLWLRTTPQPTEALECISPIPGKSGIYIVPEIYDQVTNLDRKASFRKSPTEPFLVLVKKACIYSQETHVHQMLTSYTHVFLGDPFPVEILDLLKKLTTRIVHSSQFAWN